MKTFLGVHYPSTGRRNGLGALIDAGCAGIATIDCAFPVAPGRFYATRFKVASRDNPTDFYTDPLGSARRWYAALQGKWRSNPGAHCRIITNELDIETPAHGAIQNQFYLEFMRVNDLSTPQEKAGICSYSGGCPSDNAPFTLEQRWRPLLPAIQYAGMHGHFVVLHIHPQHHAPLESTNGQHISLRHRRSIAYWLNNAAHPECVITQPPRIIFNEVSNGVGGVESNLNAYIKSVTWLDQQLRNDPYNSLYTMLGLYQAGGAEPITPDAYQRLAAYVLAQPEIEIHPLAIGPVTTVKPHYVIQNNPPDNDLRDWCAARQIDYRVQFGDA